MNDFEKAYGSFPNVTILAESSTSNLQKYKPSIQISKQGSLIEFYMDAHIKNPLDTNIDAALIIAKAVMNISFTISENFYMYGEINDLTVSVVDFRPYFKTSTLKETLN